MATTHYGYQPIVELVDQISKAQNADALIAALAMVYVGIDTMAWLSLPVGISSVKRDDFCAWVNTYLKTDPSQQYQYVGIDVYAARCATLHNYGSLADLHKQPNPPKTFGYMDNGPHRADGSSVVMISIALLIRDFGNAVKIFLQAALKDPKLRVQIDSRMDTLLRTMTVEHKMVKSL